jgi:acetyl coenzyme A synthetase (ADP forming)-like protein
MIDSIKNKLDYQMEKLFKPRSVAVIGASANTEKLGYKIMSNIISSGYQGKLYPVTPKGGEVLGRKAYKSLLEIEGEVDFIAIVVRVDFVGDVIREAVQKGVKFAEIITSGFSEVGEKELENEVVATAKAGGLRIIGPNMFGVYSKASHMNATFSAKKVLEGNVAVLTQSGAIGVAMVGKTEVENVGLSSIISFGNKADINEADIVEYLETDENTKAILIYVEGIKDGERMLKNLKSVAMVKPTIILKSGVSKRGAMAVASHTGSLAGSDRVFNEIMKQSGVLRAGTMREAINWSQFLSNSPEPKGFNTLVITNGGGLGALATDSAEKWSVDLIEGSDYMSERYKSIAPDFGSLQNPIDITGGADGNMYRKALRLALEDPKVDSVVVLGTEVAVFPAEDIEAMIREELEIGLKKPVAFSFVGGKEMEERIVEMRKDGVPIFADVDDALSAFGAMYRRYRNLIRSRETVLRPELDKLDKSCKIVEKAISEGRDSLLTTEAMKILKHLKISNPENGVAKNSKEAKEIAKNIGFPVVMKILSKDILHKSDAGGVLVGLKNSDEVEKGFEKIIKNAKKYKSDANIEGVEIVEMVKPSTEIILGARRDEQFGTTVMAGVGGIYVEVFNDVSFRSYPLTREEVSRMFKSTKLQKLIGGVRGEAPRDSEILIDTILKLGEIVESCPKISDIEINPLFLYEKGLKAVDARIILNTKK